MNYYIILGISNKASDDDIKAAYRKLAMIHHPDRGGDAEKLKLINKAYDVLKDPFKRSAYDASFIPKYHNKKQNRNLTLTAQISFFDAVYGTELFLQYTLFSGSVEVVKINIPPGANNNDVISFKGLGDDRYSPYAPRGNLLVKIKILTDENWSRSGNNLITKQVINVFDLMLGCVIIIHTLNGKQVKLTIPKGTQPNTVFSIKGYGVRNIKTNITGDILVHIDVKIPIINNDTTLQKLEELYYCTKSED